MRRLKRWFCKHDYYLLTEYKMDTDPSIGYRSEEVCVMYCPKCKHEITVDKHRYDSVIARQKIDSEYREKTRKIDEDE